MVAEGEVTLGSIIKEHLRQEMPHGFMQYCFSENSKIYGVGLANGVLVGGGYAFARFMYYGNIARIFNGSVFPMFALSSFCTSMLILKNKESEKKDQFKDYVKISQKVPMSREKLTDKNNMPLTEEQLKKMGILAPDSGSDKRKEKTWTEHDP